MNLPNFFPVACHTDRVGVGSTFVAINGFSKDGAQFIHEALTRGATTIVVDNEQPVDMHLIASYGAQWYRVANTRQELARLSALAAGSPAQHLKFIGITGTKGKTISTWLMAHILKTAGYKTALMSTVANFIGDEKFYTSLTTPQPDYLQQFLKLCVEQSVEYVVMEVAAQAITMNRVDYIEFDAVLFTNFGLEHLEFYPTLDDYFAAKCELLKRRKQGAPAWLNADDEHLKQISADNINFYSPSAAQGFLATLDVHALPGSYNQYNILGASKIAQGLGISDQIIAQAVKTFPTVPGRMEKYVLPNGATAIIDYAHNPLSYQALLSYLRTQTEHLIVVFGAGGGRDASRRPQMGNIASMYADEIILTSDNPRGENPQLITQDIISGIPVDKLAHIHIELDRKVAIQDAYRKSTTGSIIALLGKGPDEYQIIGATKLPFSERTILRSL